MTKWLTVLPVFSAIAIALVLYLDRPLFDSRLKTEKSWFGIHWLQPLQPVTKSLQCDDEVRSRFLLFQCVALIATSIQPFLCVCSPAVTAASVKGHQLAAYQHRALLTAMHPQQEECVSCPARYKTAVSPSGTCQDY